MDLRPSRQQASGYFEEDYGGSPVYDDYDKVDQIRILEPQERRNAVNKNKRETMSSWLQRQASSHSVQLAATAVFSGVAAAGAIYGYQAMKRKAAVEELKASIPDISEQHQAAQVRFSRMQGYSLYESIKILTDSWK
jgi:hypothetical protein